MFVFIGTVTWSRVNNLQVNAMYYFKLRAATSAGHGPDTQVLSLKTSGYIRANSTPRTFNYGPF